MNKKIVLLVILVLSLTMIFAGCQGKNSNIVNGDFSSSTKENIFQGWQMHYDAEKDSQASFYRVPASDSDQDKGHGEYLKVSLGSSKYGANYIFQTVTLKKGATYKLTADIKTSGSIRGEKSQYVGAFVGFIEDPNIIIEQESSTMNEWNKEPHVLYFTPSTNKPLTLAVGIGHDKAGKANGTACFDNIKLEKVNANALPEGTIIKAMKTGGEKYSLEDEGSIAFVVVGAILSCMMIAAFIYVYRKTMSREMLSSHKMLSPIALFIYMMLVAFISRFLIAAFALRGGMMANLNSLVTLAQSFNSEKITNIVATGTTLPAGMLYMLYILNGIANLLHIDGDGFNLLIRLPFILADLVAIYMIYAIVSKNNKEHTAVFVAGLYAVLPEILMISTGWGMEVSLVGCLLIGMFYCLMYKKYIGVSVLFTVSLLFSNLTVLLLPIVLAFLINSFVKNSDARLKIGLSSLISLICFYAITVPFVVKYLSAGKPFFYFTLMFKNLTSLNVLTNNAFNLYGMIGLNMVAIPKAINILNYIFVIALMTALVLLYLRNRDRRNVILMSSFMLIAVATLSPRASVEMMALGIVLLFFYAVIASSRRIYALVGAYSGISFINMALIMSNSGYISNQLNAGNVVNFFKLDPTFIVFSLISVLLVFYFGYVVFDVCFREREYEIAPLDGKLKDDIRTRYELFKENRRNRKTRYEAEEDN